GQATPHRQRVGSFEGDLGSFDVGGGIALGRAIDAGEGLGPQRTCSGAREGDHRTSMIDGDRPVVAGDIPVELVVIVKEACAVGNGVIDVDGSSGIDCLRNVDLQVAVISGSGSVVLQLAAVAVGNTGNIQKQGVIGTARAGIFNRDKSVDAVPLSVELESDAFVDSGRAVFCD